MNMKRVWLDLETTGLNPRHDWILELGMILTDGPDFDEIDAVSWVLHANNFDLQKMIKNPKVEAMHRGSGLWDECVASELGDIDVQELAIGWLMDHEAIELPLCGSGVGRFDEQFLKVDMPELASKFHYRSFDVSAYRVHLPMLGIELPAKRECHRALDDLRDSIGLARHVTGLLRRAVA